MHQIDQTMCPERVDRKKLLGRHSKVALPFKKNTETATWDVL